MGSSVLFVKKNPVGLFFIWCFSLFLFDFGSGIFSVFVLSNYWKSYCKSVTNLAFSFNNPKLSPHFVSTSEISSLQNGQLVLHDLSNIPSKHLSHIECPQLSDTILHVFTSSDKQIPHSTGE